MKRLLLISVFSLQASMAAFAGGRDGGGGDTVICQPSKQNDFNGIYALDYVVTFNKLNRNSDIVEVKSWEESIERIKGFLGKYAPSRLANFENFIKYENNSTDYSAPMVWMPGPSTLIDIQDEKLTRLIPDNCKSSKGEKGIFQTVIRSVSNRKQIQYEVDADLILELKKSPLQYSFLMVHEWLRNFNEDSAVIRNINRYLHSNVWKNQPIQKVYSALRALDFVSDEEESLAQHQARANMVDAMDRNDLGKLEYLLATGVPYLNSPYVKIDKPMNMQITLYAYALLKKKEAIAKLIKPYIDPSNDGTAVVVALFQKDIELAQRLIAEGFIKPDNTHKDGDLYKVVVENTIKNDDVDFLKSLLENWLPDVSQISLFETAVVNRSSKVFHYLLGNFDINSPEQRLRKQFSTTECLGINCYYNYFLEESNLLTELILNHKSTSHLEFLFANAATKINLKQTFKVRRQKQVMLGGWKYWDSYTNMTVMEILSKAQNRWHNDKEYVKAMHEIEPVLKKHGVL